LFGLSRLHGSNSTEQNQHDQNDQKQAQSAAGVIPQFLLCGHAGQAPNTISMSSTNKAVPNMISL
jgi:hypothetical protein